MSWLARRVQHLVTNLQEAQCASAQSSVEHLQLHPQENWFRFATPARPAHELKTTTTSRKYLVQCSLGQLTKFAAPDLQGRSEEHTSELQSLMRISYAVFCLKKKNNYTRNVKIA